jgi:hypothetical protein
MKTIIIIVFPILFYSLLFSQEKQKEFIEALINDNKNLKDFIDKDELERSERLGINYDSVKCKFMISYDIDDKVKEEIKTNGIKYEVKTIALDKDYSLTEFTVSSLNYVKQFYFKNGKWISPMTYFSKDWITKTSKYFIFKISEPKYFNDYCINKLDEFVDSIAVLLEFDEQQKQLLEKEKIYYILCKDEKEIEQVTGFNTRGIYITAFDEVVTTYNTHYHELTHLLMNYKLKNLSLYTLPFFMEGFAVAVGGRGGMAKRVVLDIGYYLQKSGFLTYDSILTNDGFYKEDASMTYPVAGLYNAFLLKELGAGKYVELYKNVNGGLDYIKAIDNSNLVLPGGSGFVRYLDNYGDKKLINLEFRECFKRERNECGLFQELDNFYCFNMWLNNMYLFPEAGGPIKDYESRLYEDISNKKYNGAVYLLNVDTTFVKVYNCYSNELIFAYDINFSTEHNQVPTGWPQIGDPRNKPRGFYSFSLAKSIFDMKFSSIMIINVNPTDKLKK